MNRKDGIQELDSRFQFLKELKLEMERIISSDAVLIQKAYDQNQWFTPDNVRGALSSISSVLLNEPDLKTWLDKYNVSSKRIPKTIGIVMAGNLPLVNFHDLLSCLISGFTVKIKLSGKDSILLPELISRVVERMPEFRDRVQMVDKLQGVDAVIATGSDNSSKYFKQYFGHLPHIFRKNRTSIAILNGSESELELKALGLDIFKYFGLGCRSVSSILIPKEFDLDRLFKAWQSFGEIALHSKYRNNYEYYSSVYMLNQIPFLTNGVVILKEDDNLHPPLSVIHYSRYSSDKELIDFMAGKVSELQCIVGNVELDGISPIQFGQSQSPGLFDYPDNIDIMSFLEKIHQHD